MPQTHLAHLMEIIAGEYSLRHFIPNQNMQYYLIEFSSVMTENIASKSIFSSVDFLKFELVGTGVCVSSFVLGCGLLLLLLILVSDIGGFGRDKLTPPK